MKNRRARERRSKDSSFKMCVRMRKVYNRDKEIKQPEHEFAFVFTCMEKCRGVR